MEVRVRYAPSPTGLQHIGGVRTALFNYFFAKASGGKFYLRIEDTDQGRLDERSVQDIYDTFEWLGIKLDEGPREGGPYGPYIQSERLALYQEHAKKLIDAGLAYHCFCTAEDLEKIREEQKASGTGTGYDRRCRHLSLAEAAKRAAAGERHVVRFKMPTEGETVVRDILLGDVAWPNKDAPADPVILKADGFPTYHLAHAVDDHLMKTSHVLRGQEWLPSAPLHVQLFQAFGWESPVYCHLSVITGTDGQKLSKRHGSTSAQQFRLGGYVPEAIINYITLLGWSYDGEKDVFTKAELEKLFTLEKLSKSPAVFDYARLDHYNGLWIRQLPDAEIARLIEPELLAAGLIGGGAPARGATPAVAGAATQTSPAERALVAAAVPIARERLHKLSDASGVLGFLFTEPPLDDAAIYIPKKTTAGEVAAVLRKIIPELPATAGRGDEANEQHFHALAEQWGLKVGQVLMPLRLAVTGTTASPPLMASIRLLGAAKAANRVQAVAERLERA
jgi:glutamyl-tRNA synthetase